MRVNLYSAFRKTGSEVTQEDVQASMKEMDVYRAWFSANVLKADDGRMSDAVLIMPVSCYAPDYRDRIHGYGSPIHSELHLQLNHCVVHQVPSLHLVRVTQLPFYVCPNSLCQVFFSSVKVSESSC